MSQDYRESLVRIDHGGDYVEIWTEQKGLIAKLARLGFKEIKMQGKGVWLRGAISQISFRSISSRKGNPPTKALAALAKAREAKREAFNPT